MNDVDSEARVDEVHEQVSVCEGCVKSGVRVVPLKFAELLNLHQ